MSAMLYHRSMAADMFYKSRDTPPAESLHWSFDPSNVSCQTGDFLYNLYLLSNRFKNSKIVIWVWFSVMKTKMQKKKLKKPQKKPQTHGQIKTDDTGGVTPTLCTINHIPTAAIFWRDVRPCYTLKQHGDPLASASISLNRFSVFHFQD